MKSLFVKAFRALSCAVKCLRHAFIFPIRLYQKYISPLKGTPTCRFTPSCSAYAVEAVTEWGIVIGTLLAVWRIVRCNPFSAGGVDEVPKRSELIAFIKSLFERGEKKQNTTDTENETKNGD